MSPVSIAFVLVSLPVFAANPVLVDSPEADEDVPPRCAPAIACSAKLGVLDAMQVEAGSDGRTGDGQLIHDGQMVVRYTVSSAVELQLYSDFLYLPGTQPRSAPAVQPGAKFSLAPEGRSLPSADLSLHLTLPTYDPGQTWDFEAWWYFSKQVGAVKADLNLMVAVSDLLDTPDVQGMGTLTLTGDLGHGCNLFGEAFGTWGATQALPPGAGLFTGLSVAASDELVFDVGTEIAFHDQPIVTVFTGLTWTPQGKHRVASPAASSLQHLASVN